MKNNYRELTDNHYQNILIVFESLIVGVVVGGVIALYRITLTYAEQFTFKMYDFLRSNLMLIPAAAIILCLAGYLVGYLVSKNKMISGSGIPQLEGIMKGYFKNRKSWINTLCYKFVGGAICIGGGLSLGREGPSIQLGACVAEGLGKKVGKGQLEKRILLAGGASAGLAAAFNAPLAGVVFALEEVFKYFSPVILLSIMSSAVAADFISKEIFGMSPIFNFEITKVIPLNQYWLLISLGILLGGSGAIYNYVLLKTKQFYGKLKFLNEKTRVIIPFIVAGVLGLVFPVVLGGGHRVVEELTLENGILFLAAVLVIKFLFSMVSFGSGAPGGIFFPLIILGATIGAIFASVSIKHLGVDQELYNNFILLAMAGFLTAIVRAPITSIILIMEMTGSFTHILSLTAVAVTAYVVADLLKSPPIYEALLENMLLSEKEADAKESSQKIAVEFIVKHESAFANKQVKDVKWPGKSLLVGIRQGDKSIIPHGDTLLREGDYLTVLADANSESRIKETLDEMNEPLL